MPTYHSVIVQYTYEDEVTEETVRILAQIAAQGAGVVRVKAWLTGNRAVQVELPGVDAPRRAEPPVLAEDASPVLE